MGEAEAKLNATVVLGPLFIGVAAAVVYPAAREQTAGFARVAAAIFSVGFILFAWAKLSIIKTGNYFSFGSARMTYWNQLSYRTGYFLMATGMAGTLFWLKVQHQ